MSGWARERRGSWRDRPDSQLWASDPTCGRGSSCEKKAEEGGRRIRPGATTSFSPSPRCSPTTPDQGREEKGIDQIEGREIGRRDQREKRSKGETEGKRGGALHPCKRPWRLICSKVTAALPQGSSGPDPRQVLHHAALQDLLCCSSSPRIFLCCSSSRPTPRSSPSPFTSADRLQLGSAVLLRRLQLL